MPKDTAKLRVTIARGAGEQLFEVPAAESQTILDVVSWIQQHADPTLSYRFACRVGMCGSCAMMVNHVPRWTCRTHVKKVARDGHLHIAPLRNLPVIKDLVTDMDPFFDKWVAAEARHHPTRSRDNDPVRIDQNSRARRRANAAIECINCAVCYAACDTVTDQPDYLGPAALQRAWTLINDVRDGGHEEILHAVSQSDGCHNCHAMGNCTAFCPNELDPMGAIAGLKGATVRRVFKRGK